MGKRVFQQTLTIPFNQVDTNMKHLRFKFNISSSMPFSFNKKCSLFEEHFC